MLRDGTGQSTISELLVKILGTERFKDRYRVHNNSDVEIDSL